jgi:hypothetical protein
VWIEGTLNCLLFSRLSNGNNTVVANQIFKYSILLNGNNTTWSVLTHNIQTTNPYIRPDESEDELTILTNSTNPSEINLNLEFYDSCQYQIKNTFTIIVNSY